MRCTWEQLSCMYTVLCIHSCGTVDQIMAGFWCFWENRPQRLPACALFHPAPITRVWQVRLSRTKAWFQQFAWYQARLMCCLGAARVGGMFSIDLDFWLKSGFLALLTSMQSLVQSYISTTKCSSRDIDSSLTSVIMAVSSRNASFTSEMDFHVSHAVFFPLPANADVVSHPVMVWKIGSVLVLVGVSVVCNESWHLSQERPKAPWDSSCWNRPWLAPPQHSVSTGRWCNMHMPACVSDGCCMREMPVPWKESLAVAVLGFWSILSAAPVVKRPWHIFGGQLDNILHLKLLAYSIGYMYVGWGL